jgi:hypothetical protein
MFVIVLLVFWVYLATLDSYGLVMYSWIVVPLGVTTSNGAWGFVWWFLG